MCNIPQAQYIFIHDALEELITCGETSIQAQELRTALNLLHKVNPNTATTGFEEQFQVCPNLPVVTVLINLLS